MIASGKVDFLTAHHPQLRLRTETNQPRRPESLHICKIIVHTYIHHDIQMSCNAVVICQRLRAKQALPYLQLGLERRGSRFRTQLFSKLFILSLNDAAPARRESRPVCPLAGSDRLTILLESASGNVTVCMSSKNHAYAGMPVLFSLPLLPLISRCCWSTIAALQIQHNRSPSGLVGLISVSMRGRASTRTAALTL